MITVQDIKEQIEWDKLTCPALFDSEWFDHLLKIKLEDIEADDNTINN